MSQHFSAYSDDPFFPSRLRRDPEICSFVEAQGVLAEALDRLSPAVAIVGTRSPPDAAARFTRWFAAELARAGVTIVSGGAYGIDAAAHEGALDVGGRTVAVLGTPIDERYPIEHANLFERIVESGALVSIEPRGSNPNRNLSFPRRNAVIAALADHVVMTCAPFDSGARITIRYARTMKIDTWIVPGAPWDLLTEANAIETVFGDATRVIEPSPMLKRLGLKGRGNPPRFIHPHPNPERTERVERAVGPRALIERPSEPRKRRPAPQRPEPASMFPAPRRTLETCESILPSADERRVAEALREGPVTIDELVLQTGLGVPSLRGLLLTWTVEGVVREGPAGLFRLVND